MHVMFQKHESMLFVQALGKEHHHLAQLHLTHAVDAGWHLRVHTCSEDV